MSRETLAEVIGNLEGADLDDDATWERLLREADGHMDDAETLFDGYKWWEDESR